MKHAAAFLGLFALLLAASGLLVSCGNDSSAPEDISGTWVGTASGDGETLDVTAVITQTGSSIEVVLIVEGWGAASSTGTYVNGTAAFAWGGGNAELQVSGNKMTGVANFAEETYSVSLTRQ